MLHDTVRRLDGQHTSMDFGNQAQGFIRIPRHLAHTERRHGASATGGFAGLLVWERNRRTETIYTCHHTSRHPQARQHHGNTHHAHYAGQSAEGHPRHRPANQQPLAHAAAGIHAEEYEQQDGEAPKRGTSIAEERQGNTDDRSQPQYHTYINK